MKWGKWKCTRLFDGEEEEEEEEEEEGKSSNKWDMTFNNGYVKWTRL